jgi:general secretion pathway protein F
MGMPLFQYKALTEEGKNIKGVIDADSLAFAKERLRKQKILVTSLIALSEKRQQLTLNKTQLLSFTRELTQLLKAGLPLYESLVTIEEKHRRSKIHPLFVDLCDQLKNGMSLSNALQKYSQTFNELYLSMIRSAEQSGTLYEAFDQLTMLISKQLKLKKQLTSALAYPAFLGSFCLLVIGALFFFVIPSMQELFEGRKLHPLTECVLGISTWLQNNSLFFLLVLVVIGSGLFVLSKKTAFRRMGSKALLWIPFFNTIIIQAALVRFFRAMFMLLSGGVPLVDSLHHSQKTVQNELLEELVIETQKRVVEGKKLSFLFSTSPLVPSLVVRMFAIGEETGNMGFVMRNLAEIYEEELDKNLQQLTTFLQPAILLFLGAVVGLVVLSILLPLTDVSSFLSS